MLPIKKGTQRSIHKNNRVRYKTKNSFPVELSCALIFFLVCNTFYLPTHSLHTPHSRKIAFARALDPRATHEALRFSLPIVKFLVSVFKMAKEGVCVSIFHFCNTSLSFFFPPYLVLSSLASSCPSGFSSKPSLLKSSFCIRFYHNCRGAGNLE